MLEFRCRSPQPRISFAKFVLLLPLFPVISLRKDHTKKHNKNNCEKMWRCLMIKLACLSRPSDQGRTMQNLDCVTVTPGKLIN